MEDDLTYPYPADATQLLALALRSERALIMLLGDLTERDFVFVDPRHRYLYVCLRVLYGRGESIDARSILAISSELGFEGELTASYLEQLESLEVDREASDLLRSAYDRSMAHHVANALDKAAYEARKGIYWLDYERLELGRAADTFRGSKSPITFAEVTRRIVDGVTENIAPTQIADEVDGWLGGGLAPGSLTFVAGPKNVGTTWLLLSAAANLAMQPTGVIIFSGERSSEAMARRILSAFAAVDYRTLVKGNLELSAAVRDALPRAAKLPILVMDGPFRGYPSDLVMGMRVRQAKRTWRAQGQAGDPDSPERVVVLIDGLDSLQEVLPPENDGVPYESLGVLASVCRRLGRVQNVAILATVRVPERAEEADLLNGPELAMLEKIGDNVLLATRVEEGNCGGSHKLKLTLTKARDEKGLPGDSVVLRVGPWLAGDTPSREAPTRS